MGTVPNPEDLGVEALEDGEDREVVVAIQVVDHQTTIPSRRRVEEAHSILGLTR